jgi:hypothetical protein
MFLTSPAWNINKGDSTTMTVREATEIYEKLKALDAETRRWLITALFRTLETEGKPSADPSFSDPERRNVQ